MRFRSVVFAGSMVTLSIAAHSHGIVSGRAQVQIEARILQVDSCSRINDVLGIDFSFKNTSGATQTGASLTLTAPANYLAKGYAFDTSNRAVRCDSVPSSGSTFDNSVVCLVATPWVENDTLNVRMRITPTFDLPTSSYRLQVAAEYAGASGPATEVLDVPYCPLSSTGPKLSVEKYAEDDDSYDGYGPLDHLHTGDVFWYEIDVYNDSVVASSGPVTITDALPPGLKPLEVYAYHGAADGVTCSLSGSTVTCTRQTPITSDHKMAIDVLVQVTAESGTIANRAAVSGGGDGPHNSNLSFLPVNPFVIPGTCIADALTACLLGNIFQQRLVWFATDLGESGVSFVQPLTSDTTAHSFFTLNNIDLVTKVVDGRAVNGFYWLFGGGLTNVAYLLQTVNTLNGDRNWVFNRPKRLSSYAFTDAFRGGTFSKVFSDARSVVCEVGKPGDLFTNADVEAFPDTVTSPAAVAPCVAGATTLCLNSGRFKVTAHWEALHLGTSGEGQAVPIVTPAGTDTGTFWFFSSNNIELVIKALDGRAVNNHFWVFYGALSNVKYTITVTDTQTGIVKTYVNSQDTQASVADTSAF